MVCHLSSILKRTSLGYQPDSRFLADFIIPVLKFFLVGKNGVESGIISCIDL